MDLKLPWVKTVKMYITFKITLIPSPDSKIDKQSQFLLQIYRTMICYS